MLSVKLLIRKTGQEMPLALAFSLQDEAELLPGTVAVSDLRLDGNLLHLDKAVLRLQALAQLQVQTSCARCLCPVTMDLFCQIEDTLVPDNGLAEWQWPDDLELDDKEDFETYEGSCIDLKAIARRFLIQELPYRVLCRPDCAGLCPHCGQDLNDMICSCSAADAEKEDLSPFAKLKKLL